MTYANSSHIWQGWFATFEKELLNYDDVLINTFSIFIGGITGAVAGNKLSQSFKDYINIVFGLCSMGMGISTDCSHGKYTRHYFFFNRRDNIGDCNPSWEKYSTCNWSDAKSDDKIYKNASDKYSAGRIYVTLVTVIILFCLSGTGIYGSIVSGMTGGHSILIVKSILGLFTALVFASSFGMVVSLIAVPQAIIFLLRIDFSSDNTRHDPCHDMGDALLGNVYFAACRLVPKYGQGFIMFLSGSK